MKKKLIGIPIFLYLLLSVSITTCDPTKLSKQAQAQSSKKPSDQAKVYSKAKAHPKFTKAIHDELFTEDKCILKQIASDLRIDIADHTTIIKKYAESYLKKAEPCQSPACDKTPCKERLTQIEQIILTSAEIDLIKQASENALKQTSPEAQAKLKTSSKTGDIENESIKALLKNAATILAGKGK